MTVSSCSWQQQCAGGSLGAVEIVLVLLELLERHCPNIQNLFSHIHLTSSTQLLIDVEVTG